MNQNGPGWSINPLKTGPLRVRSGPVRRLSLSTEKSLVQLSIVIAVLGGVLTLVGGILEMTGLLSRNRIPGWSVIADTIVVGIVLVVLGIVGVAGALRMKTVVWCIVVLIVGFLAFSFGGGFPWWWGSIMMIVGGVLGTIGDLI